VAEKLQWIKVGLTFGPQAHSSAARGLIRELDRQIGQLALTATTESRLRSFDAQVEVKRRMPCQYLHMQKDTEKLQLRTLEM
jgi:hypothetical protein